MLHQSLHRRLNMFITVTVLVLLGTAVPLVRVLAITNTEYVRLLVALSAIDESNEQQAIDLAADEPSLDAALDTLIEAGLVAPEQEEGARSIIARDPEDEAEPEDEHTPEEEEDSTDTETEDTEVPEEEVADDVHPLHNIRTRIQTRVELPTHVQRVQPMRPDWTRRRTDAQLEHVQVSSSMPSKPSAAWSDASTHINPVILNERSMFAQLSPSTTNLIFTQYSMFRFTGSFRQAQRD